MEVLTLKQGVVRRGVPIDAFVGAAAAAEVERGRVRRGLRCAEGQRFGWSDKVFELRRTRSAEVKEVSGGATLVMQRRDLWTHLS